MPDIGKIPIWNGTEWVYAYLSIFRLGNLSPIGTYSIDDIPLTLRIGMDGWTHTYEVVDQFGNVDPYLSHDFCAEFSHRVLNAQVAGQMGTWLQVRWSKRA